jgi:ADP-ribose pyrophosphatase YjhB (NUDIX family)
METGPIAHNQPPRFAIGGVLYRCCTDGQVKILLIKKQGGSWTLPKGHIEANEPAQVALEREMLEEVALRGTVEALLSTVTYSIIKRGHLRPKIVQYYLMHITRGTPRPNRREGIRQARWFMAPAALQRVQNERVRTIIEQAILHLNHLNEAQVHYG